MQYSQEHLKTIVYAEFGGQTECIMGNLKIENGGKRVQGVLSIMICFFVFFPGHSAFQFEWA